MELNFKDYRDYMAQEPIGFHIPWISLKVQNFILKWPKCNIYDVGQNLQINLFNLLFLLFLCNFCYFRFRTFISLFLGVFNVFCQIWEKLLGTPEVP